MVLSKKEQGGKFYKKKVSALENKTLGYIMLIPATLAIFAIAVYPFTYGILLSFQEYNLRRPAQRAFIGLDNFVRILTTDREFYSTLQYSFFFTAMVVLLSYITGLGLALLLNRDIRFRGFFRAMILMPWVISPAVAATSWIWVLNDRVGIINTTLRDLGIIDTSIQFLANTDIVRWTVIFTSVWRSYPFMMIVILAGLQGIPKDLYESAHIDGAGFFKSFAYITMPMLKTVSAISTTLMFIWTFNNFEGIYLLTRGGPNRATFVLPILTYYMAFYRSHLGYASAIAVIMLVIMVAMSVIYLKFINKTEVD